METGPRTPINETAMLATAGHLIQQIQLGENPAPSATAQLEATRLRKITPSSLL